MKLRIDVVKHGKHGRSFQTNLEIGKQVISLYSGFSNPQQNYFEAYGEHGRIIAEMVRDLRKIGGIGDIFVKPYEVTVFKEIGGNSFTDQQWNEKIDQIVEKAFRAIYAELYPATRRLVIVTYPNDRRRGFNTTFEISNSRFETFQRPLRLSSLEYLRKVGIDGGGELVRKLLQISGVTEVSIRPYEANVEIAGAFSWTEPDSNGMSIVDKIVDAFEKVFGSDIAVSNK